MRPYFRPVDARVSRAICGAWTRGIEVSDARKFARECEDSGVEDMLTRGSEPGQSEDSSEHCGWEYQILSENISGVY